ncbi:LysR family transcriptional regulator [Marimonas sp. MJW-29]|uniref:LysR family transcriptional regulator n=1 Tax=Sulfitobacter sediminis TaxID=3234186 RepID=A0ABV3RIW9_9RHOB
MQNLDWSLLQSFAAVAEHGSLSAAARATQSSQPTLSRHITQLEEAIGTRLFERSKAGVALTERGSALYEQAAQMADAAARLAMTAHGPDNLLQGTVRITASQIVATYLLPDVLVELHDKFPAVEIELVASDDTNNLLRREADIALRMYRPTQNDMISRHIGNLDLGAYASRRYIEARGRPQGLEDLMQHDLIGYDRSPLIIDGMNALGFKADRCFFKFRCDDQVVCWQMARAGFGIGFNQKAIAERDGDMICVSGETPVGQLPVWLTAHPELRQSLRIRKIFDFLGKAVSKRLSRP